MKSFWISIILISFFSAVNAQEEATKSLRVPAIDIKTMDGKTFNTSAISNEGKPVIITFWATWCKPCLKEHDAINEIYSEWVEETGVKLYAVSIDNARSSKSVMPLVNGKSWEFNILLDENSDFKRAMNVNVPPHTFVVDGGGHIVWQHVGYLEGDEAEYIEIVNKVLKGEKID